MEKFTVDIGKILDDFEFNESQGEDIKQTGNSSIKSLNLLANSHEEEKHNYDPAESSIDELKPHSDVEILNGGTVISDEVPALDSREKFSFNSVQPDLLSLSSITEDFESKLCTNGFTENSPFSNCTTALPDVTANSHMGLPKPGELNDLSLNSNQISNSDVSEDDIAKCTEPKDTSEKFDFKDHHVIDRKELEEYFENLEQECLDVVCNESIDDSHSVNEMCGVVDQTDSSSGLQNDETYSIQNTIVEADNLDVPLVEQHNINGALLSESLGVYSKCGTRPKDFQYSNKIKSKSASDIVCSVSEATDKMDVNKKGVSKEIEPESISESQECDVSKMNLDNNDLLAMDNSALQRPSSLDIPVQSINKSGEDCLNHVNISSSSSPTSSTSSLNCPMAENSIPLDTSEHLSDEEKALGIVAPYWVPDKDAPCCMQCDSKFTMIKRRHHCRACGKVFCSSCCSTKVEVPYLENVARVCCLCSIVLSKVATVKAKFDGDCGDGSFNNSPSYSPNPNNPLEYCSTIPPLEQVAHNKNASPPTVMVPVGVLKREGSVKNRAEPKQVIFSDGIRPGGDPNDIDEGSYCDYPSGHRLRMPSKRVERVPTPSYHPSKSISSHDPKYDHVMKTKYYRKEDGIPPVVLNKKSKGEIAIKKVEVTDQKKLICKMKDESAPPVVFVLNSNLFVHVKIVNLICCVGKPHWCFSTRGMCTAGQDELLILLQYEEDENNIPTDIFAHLSSVYNEAFLGNPVNAMGHTLFNGPFLGSRDHGGFLYIRPTFQCLQNLLLPNSPFLVGVLLQKWETPWAKVFPIRLMLRLGAEFRYYPCPLFSIRDRRPVFCEVGHTIMNLLADFRNFAYMLSTVPGMTIHMEDKKTSVLIPRNRYKSMMKALANSNDYVLALGSNFSVQADSHLVCIQKEDGNYQTQAINILNKPRKVTGASFIVFNGALKSSSGLTAKSSIVEDGMMIQFPPDVMSTLQAALREMNDFEMGCGPIGAKVPDEMVVVQWVEDDRNFNVGVKSPIDGKSLEGVPSIKIKPSSDLVTGKYHIKWTEVFLIQAEDNVKYEPVDISKVSENLCKSFCNAIATHLDSLRRKDLCHIGLRVFIDLDSVSYEVGSGGTSLPVECMKDMDSELIPVIHEAISSNVGGPTVLELIFYILNP